MQIFTFPPSPLSSAIPHPSSVADNLLLPTSPFYRHLQQIRQISSPVFPTTHPIIPSPTLVIGNSWETSRQTCQRSKKANTTGRQTIYSHFLSFPPNSICHSIPSSVEDHVLWHLLIICISFQGTKQTLVEHVPSPSPNPFVNASYQYLEIHFKKNHQWQH